MKPKKQARPELQWPWCDVCQTHVRETSGVKHACSVLVSLQLTFTWMVAR